MKVTLQPNEVYIIRDNPFRKYLAVTCNGDFEFDDMPLLPNAVVERLMSLGENPMRSYRIKNISLGQIECVISEEIEV